MPKMKQINFFILDLDGTIYLENKLIYGSLEFLKKLKRNNKKYIFLTNNSSKNRNDYQNKLSKLGIKVKAEQIINSGEITASYLLKQGTNSKKRIYLLGTKSLKKEMERFGHVIVNNEKNIAKRPESVDYVVLGFDKNLNYQRLWDAHELILAGVNYIATHPDLICPLSNGRSQPDAGAIIELLAASTGKRPLIIGKPSLLTVNYILSKYDFKKSETAMIGDRLYTDMKMAKNAAITAVLLLSGESKKEDIEKLENKEKHFDYVYKDIKEFAINFL